MSDHYDDDLDVVDIKPDHVPDDLDAKLAQLEDMIATAKTVPLSSSIMFNRAEIDGMVSDLRASMPEEVRQARWVMKERDEVLEAAHAESHRVLEEARNERARLIARTEVVQAANREAERIVDDARERSRKLRLEAEDYVDAKLATFEVVLNKTLGAVHRGREKLRGRLDEDEFADDLVRDDL